MLRALPVVAYLAILVFTLVDLAMIDSSRVRALPKFAWILIVILLPVVGIALWFFVGRERLDGSRGGRSARRPTAPDDDPEFLSRLNRERAEEERIRDLERQLGELDDDDDKKV